LGGFFRAGPEDPWLPLWPGRCRNPPKKVKPALDVVHTALDLTLLLTIHLLTLSLTTSIQRFNLRRWPASIFKEIVLNIPLIDLSEFDNQTF
jgi:hypothetical protein